MRLFPLAPALLLAGCSANPAPPASVLTGSMSAQAERALAGKIAGEPVNCLARYNADDPSRLPNGGVVYRVSDDLAYVQDFGGQCAGVLRDSTYLQRRSIQSSLCAGEPVQVISRIHGTFEGTCIIAPFTPYRTPGT